MASGLFIGLEEGELLAIRKAAIAGITKGLNIVSYSDSGSSVSKQWAMPPREMLDEASYALYNFDPQQYAALKRTSVLSTNWQYRRY